MVFQELNLFPHMSVLQNLIEAPIKVLGVPKAEAVELLSPSSGRSGTDKRDEYPAVCLADSSELAIRPAEPKVFLFDEPTSALDPSHR
jgi:ABC-type histidine transport system ATPase subunit